MKKRLLSLFLTVIMLFSALPVFAVSHMPTLTAAFNEENITLGTISAEVTTLNATDSVAFTLGYYSGGAMVCCSSVTLNEGTQTITLETPYIVKEGDWAKIIAYNPSTLEPYTITNSSSPTALPPSGECSLKLVARTKYYTNYTKNKNGFGFCQIHFLFTLQLYTRTKALYFPYQLQ